MVLFLDANVILDVVLNREGFAENARVIFQLAKNGEVQLCASDITFTTVAYYARKNRTVDQLYQVMQTIRSLVAVAPSGKLAIDWALQRKAKDFEDAVQYFCALHYGADKILTRNLRDYPFDDIPVISPRDFLKEMGIEI